MLARTSAKYEKHHRDKAHDADGESVSDFRWIHLDKVRHGRIKIFLSAFGFMKGREGVLGRKLFNFR